jgi:hypothetical protein
VDIKYIVWAVTGVDYLRIRRRIMNSRFEASNIRHLRSSGMLPGVGSECYQRFGTTYQSQFQGTSSLEIQPETHGCL